MHYFSAKIIMSSFTWNGSTPLIDGSSFSIRSDTILFYLRNVLIINKVSWKSDLDSSFGLAIILILQKFLLAKFTVQLIFIYIVTQSNIY